MKKIILSLLFIAAVFANANAQSPKGFHPGGGIRLGLPVGDFNEVSAFGAGVELQLEYGCSKKISGVFTTGYTSFIGKSVQLDGYSIKLDPTGYIPFLAGVRIYPSSQFFIGGQAGLGLLSGRGNTEGAFNYQPQIGYNGKIFQFALNYNTLTKDGSNSSHIGLSVIYKFGCCSTAKSKE